jgi:DNA-binding NarL/FixJ family response regulator
VLRLIAAGRTNKEIAARLVLSERTIARHITNLYAKIDVRSKAEAAAYAIQRSLT